MSAGHERITIHLFSVVFEGQKTKSPPMLASQEDFVYWQDQRILRWGFLTCHVYRTIRGVLCLPRRGNGIGSQLISGDSAAGWGLGRVQRSGSQRTPPDFRDAHTPVQYPAHRDLIHSQRRVQAGAESVAAPLVRANARNIEVLPDFQPVNPLGNLAVLARLLNTRTG